MTAAISAGASRVPLTARWLGALGALPFFACALASTVLDGGLQVEAMIALTAYGAVILSFLGGIQWGLAIAAGGGKFRRLSVSILPALFAWGGLLLPPGTGALVIAAALACVLLVDIKASRNQEAPTWYPKLRWPLTVAAASALLLGATLG